MKDLSLLSDAEIDDLLMEETIPQWRKVARVIGRAMLAAARQHPYVDDFGKLELKFEQRLASLIAEGKLESAGDISNYRYSEVRRIENN